MAILPVTEHMPDGISDRAFKRIKIDLLTKGTFDPNLWDSLNSYQRFWVNQTKITIRDLRKEQ